MSSSFHARHENLFDVSRVERARVLVVGAGSLGSAVSALLVRSGVRSLCLVDKDVVEEANLSRTTYLARDLGLPKVDALARHLREIRPSVEVKAENADLRARGDDEVRAWIAESDLVLALTDSPAVQARLGFLTYHSVPAVFAGVYERGIGGEVFFTLPDETPCYDCMVGAVRGAPPRPGRPNYGVTTGERTSEPALGVDALRISVAATKIALGLLLRGTDARAAALAARGTTMALLGNDVDWIWKWPMETVWARAERKADCICRLRPGESTASLLDDAGDLAAETGGELP